MVLERLENQEYPEAINYNCKGVVMCDPILSLDHVVAYLQHQHPKVLLDVLKINQSIYGHVCQT